MLVRKTDADQEKQEIAQQLNGTQARIAELTGHKNTAIEKSKVMAERLRKSEQVTEKI